MNGKQKRAERLMPNGLPRWIRVYDNGGETADRYTVVFTGLRTGWHQLLSMSGAPFHPQGVCLSSEIETYKRVDTPQGWELPPAIGRKHPALGRRIRFEDLPEDCRTVVLRDYRELWNIEGAAR